MLLKLFDFFSELMGSFAICENFVVLKSLRGFLKGDFSVKLCLIASAKGLIFVAVVEKLCFIYFSLP